MTALVLALLACQQPTPSTAPSGATGGGEQVKVSFPTDAQASTPPGEVVAKWEGGQLTYGDLVAQVQNQLIQAEIEYLTKKNQIETQAMHAKVGQTLLEAEAKARGLADADALVKAEVVDKIAEPSDAEVQQFYGAMSRQLGGQPLEAVKPRIVAEIMRRKQGERFEAFIGEIEKKYAVSYSLPLPNLPKIHVSVDDDPMKGNPEAPVTIVQFAEFQCPYCGKSKETVDQILKDYDGKVRMVFRDFPLGFHDRAVPAAVAANCGGVQGKYWEMFDLMMTNQRALTDSDLEGYAKKAGVKDMSAWKTCLADPKQKDEVLKDQEAGAEAGVTGTPAFFINGVMLSGALPYDQFKAVVDRELELVKG